MSLSTLCTNEMKLQHFWTLVLQKTSSKNCTPSNWSYQSNDSHILDQYTMSMECSTRMGTFTAILTWRCRLDNKGPSYASPHWHRWTKTHLRVPIVHSHPTKYQLGPRMDWSWPAATHHMCTREEEGLHQQMQYHTHRKTHHETLLCTSQWLTICSTNTDTRWRTKHIKETDTHIQTSGAGRITKGEWRNTN